VARLHWILKYKNYFSALKLRGLIPCFKIRLVSLKRVCHSLLADLH